MRETLAHAIAIDGLQLVITPSIGIALYPDHGASAALLIANADAAMYQSKRLRSAWAFFEAR